MAVFNITGPDGKKYRVTGDTAEGALSALQSMLGDGAATRPKPPVPEKSFGTRASEFLFGDNDPTTQNLGEKIGTTLNKAGEGLTSGLIGDEASAAVESLLPGVNYADRRDYYRDQERLLEKTNPGVALTADVGGALAGALTPMGAIGTLGRGAGLMPRVAASVAAGAGMGGLYGFMEGEGAEDRLAQAKTGAAIGGIAGAVAPAIGAGVQKFADSRAVRAALANAAKGAPTSEQLRTAGNAAYKAIDDANVQIRPQAFDAARQKIVDALRANTGFDELPAAGSHGYPGMGGLTPNTARVVQIMEQASGKMAKEPTAALPFSSLDQMRRQAGAAAGNVANRTDAQAGREVISGLDDFVRGMRPNDVVSGDVTALQTLIPKARDVWSRMRNSQLVDDAIEAGENNYLSGGASGIRNQFRRILNNPKLARGFSASETAAMRRVVNGTIPEQTLNLLGGGLGQLAQIGAGLGLGGPVGAVLGVATAAGARKASEAVVKRNAELARAIIAGGKARGNLPVATDSARRLVEALLRRNSAAIPQ